MSGNSKCWFWLTNTVVHFDFSIYEIQTVSPQTVQETFSAYIKSALFRSVIGRKGAPVCASLRNYIGAL